MAKIWIDTEIVYIFTHDLFVSQYRVYATPTGYEIVPVLPSGYGEPIIIPMWMAFINAFDTKPMAGLYRRAIKQSMGMELFTKEFAYDQMIQALDNMQGDIP